MSANMAVIDWTAIMAEVQARRKAGPGSWVFDQDTQRWRWPNTGHAVQPKRMKLWLDTRQRNLKEQMAELGRDYANGVIERDEFVAEMRLLVKEGHIQARLLAVGGREYATPADWGSVGNALRKEYGWLEDFANKEGMSEAYAAVRAQMYGGANVANSYYRGALGSHKRAGFGYKRRSGPNDGHTCQTCSDEIAAGWVDINESGFELGHTDCRANDRCEIEFSRSGEGE